MSPAARSGGSHHRIIDDDGHGSYTLSWRTEHKYSGSRLLHHRVTERSTDYPGACRFAKKWKVPMPGEVLLWARRVRKVKVGAPGSMLPDLVIVVLEGSPGPTGLLMVCGWSASESPGADRWPSKRLAQHLPTLTKEWRELSGAGWKLEIGA